MSRHYVTMADVQNINRTINGENDFLFTNKDLMLEDLTKRLEYQSMNFLPGKDPMRVVRMAEAGLHDLLVRYRDRRSIEGYEVQMCDDFTIIRRGLYSTVKFTQSERYRVSRGAPDHPAVKQNVLALGKKPRGLDNVIGEVDVFHTRFVPLWARHQLRTGLARLDLTGIVDGVITPDPIIGASGQILQQRPPYYSHTNERLFLNLLDPRS